MNSVDFELKEFYEKSPSATIQDYLKFIEEKKLSEQENNIKKEEWYNQQVGKYYFVNHNGPRKTYYKLTSRNRYGFIADDSYTVDCRGLMSNEHNVFFNEAWLHNPYDKNSGNGVVVVTEITENEFNEIVEKFKNFVVLINEFYEIR